MLNQMALNLKEYLRTIKTIMKKILLLGLFALFFNQLAFSQAELMVKETTFDFGKIKAGSDTLWHSFEIKNIGNEPLQISDVKTSCDCTLADWPKGEIAPGKSALIKGGFKIEGKSGTFEKNIILYANTAPAVTILTLKGEIITTP
jgi:hypothetical protein